MKRMKKSISFLLIALLIGATFILGSSSWVDPVLETATEITRLLFNSYEGEDLSTHDYIPSTYIKGLDGEQDYILSERESGGYAIFEKESMELIEYSPTDKSPYSEIEQTQRHYAGPVNYFQGKDGEFKSLTTKALFTSKQVEPIALELKQKLKADRLARIDDGKVEITPIDKELETMGEVGLIGGNVVTNGVSNSTTVIDPGPTGTLIADASAYDVASATYISLYQFFVDNAQHGINLEETGICSSIATQLLLAYYNWGIDGRIIPERFLHPNRDPSKPYSDEMRYTSSNYSFSQNYDTEFLDVLVELVNKNTKGAHLEKVEEGIYNFLENYSTFDENEVPNYLITIENKAGIGDAIFDNMRQIILSGEPIIIDTEFYKKDSSNQLEKSYHSVVAYGYQTIRFRTESAQNQQLQGFIAHFGNIGSSHVWFNQDWVRKYLHFELDHVHSFAAEDSLNHIKGCLDCGAVVTDNNHVFDKLINNAVAIEQRGLIIIDETEQDTISSNDYSFHNVICPCGYKKKVRHNYHTYIPIYTENGGESIYHIKKCTDCLLQHPELIEHFYKAESNTCYFCSYNRLGV